MSTNELVVTLLDMEMTRDLLVDAGKRIIRFKKKNKELKWKLEIAELQLDEFHEFLKAPGIADLFRHWSRPMQPGEEDLEPPF